VFAVGAKASGNDYPSLGFAVGYSGEKSGKGAAGTAWDLDMSKGKKYWGGDDAGTTTQPHYTTVPQTQKTKNRKQKTIFVLREK